MPDLTPTEIVGDALAGWVRSMGGDPGWLRPYGAARVVLDALTAAGRLLPEGDRTRPVITIDPAKCFGSPHIRGTSTEVVASAVMAGEDFAAVADEYGLTRHEVILACWYEGSTTYRREWRSWTLAVAPALGGWKSFDPEAVDEPPAMGRPAMTAASSVPMRETWYAHPNDLIGGWAVLNRDHPPSGLNRHVDPDAREVATFMSEADARRIVELHNAATEAGDG